MGDEYNILMGMDKERSRVKPSKVVPVEGIIGGYHFPNLEPFNAVAREKLISDIRKDVALLEAEDKRTKAI